MFGHYTKISLKEIFEGCLEYRTKTYMADTRECSAIKNNSTIIDQEVYLHLFNYSRHPIQELTNIISYNRPTSLQF